MFPLIDMKKITSIASLNVLIAYFFRQTCTNKGKCHCLGNLDPDTACTTGEILGWKYILLWTVRNIHIIVSTDT